MYQKVDGTTTTTDKHKGMPRKIRLTYEDYSQRLCSLQRLEQNHNALRSGTVSYCRMGAVRHRFVLTDLRKVKLGTLSDKVYIFQNGVTTLPHGHIALQPIYDAARGKLSEELQSDEHMELLRQLEKTL